MRIALIICLASSAASADDNDLQLWKLGHPDPIGCTRCDGSIGDAAEPGDLNAQARFHKLASTLGLAFVPPFQETAGTVGQAGFEVGVSSSEAFLRISGDAWPTRAASPPKVLSMPTVTLRKGLGGSVELGAAVSWLTSSQMMALSAELRWAVVDGLASAPDIALRAWATRVIGTQELDLTVGGADLMISRGFAVAGMIKLQPYLQGGVAFVNALSSVVDFKPAAESTSNPTADDGIFRNVRFIDNRYLRGALGLRMVAGVVVLGAEVSLAQGKNPIQSDSAAGGAALSENFIRLWSASGRLGFSF
ncbi:MAG: hypothetical protein ABR567_09570 [Myxococcales bacterium]|nr:hypothetical protein [Myxococcales bacterium]